MRITVFGATGGTGRYVVQHALDAGHQVTAVVRNPAAVSNEHSRLEVVTADAMDPDAITAAVSGCDGVVSALGPRHGGATTVCSDGARAIISAMHTAGSRRLIVVTAGGHIVDDGDGPFTRVVVKPMLRRLLREGFADFARTDREVQAGGLDWTIMRPSRLTDGKSRTYRTALDRNVRGGITIARTDLARAILAALEDPATAGHTISVGY